MYHINQVPGSQNEVYSLQMVLMENVPMRASMGALEIADRQNV